MLRYSRKLLTIKICNQCVIYNRNMHCTLQHQVKENFETMDNKLVLNQINEIVGKYDKKQEENLLKIINNYNLNELLGYEITKGRANKLLAWRKKNGLLKSLSDIAVIQGFSLKVADKFLQSLLLEPKIKKLDLSKKQARTAPFITPIIEAAHKEAIKSSVSLRIGVNSITWARLAIPGQDVNAPCSLTHWENHEISEKKLHINDLIQRCMYIHHLIPTGDCYIFENPQVAQVSNNPGSVEQQNINIQKSQIIAIMGYALASRNNRYDNAIANQSEDKSKYLNNVFYIRRFLSARLFNHLVGTEKVTSQQTVVNMMRTHYNENEVNEFLVPPQQDGVLSDVQTLKDKASFSGEVLFPDELRHMFAKAPPYCREFLSQTILLNLTFVRLVLLQDSKSIAKISKGNKAKATTDDGV